MQEIVKVLVQTNAKLATALAEIKNNEGPTERVAELLAEVEQLNIKTGLLEKEIANKTAEIIKLSDYNAKLEAQIRDLIQYK